MPKISECYKKVSESTIDRVKGGNTIRSASQIKYLELLGDC